MTWQPNAHHAIVPQAGYPMVIVNSPSRRDTATLAPYPQSFDRTHELHHVQHSHPVLPPVVQQRPTTTPSQPVDYRILLLSLSDQYISAARKLAALIAHNQDGGSIEHYHQLISAGLQCLQARIYHPQLADSSQSPRQEATLQLRYASLLYEETVNYGQIEEVLNKSIMLCDRYRFQDLKYSMRYLLIRALDKTNTRTALRHLDEILLECETLQLTPWIYAFQFLRCSLLLRVHNLRDFHAAISSLRRITELARQHNDTEIVIGASLILATVYIRIRRDDAVAEAQRALATARAFLSNIDPQHLPQLFTLAYELDLLSSLDPYDQSQVPDKANHLRQFLDRSPSEFKWRRDRSCVLRLNTSGFENVLGETGGIFRRLGTTPNSGLGLTFSWLGRHEAYMVAFLLNGIASFQRNARDGHKCEQFLIEGLKGTRDQTAFEDTPLDAPLTTACEKAESRRYVRSIMLLQLAFAYVSRSEWTLAKDKVHQYRNEADHSKASGNDSDNTAKYLEAIICQGTGDLDAALEIYMEIQKSSNVRDTASLSTAKAIAILSAIDALFIVRLPSHPRHNLSIALLEDLRHWSPEGSMEKSGASLVTQHESLASAISFAIAVSSQANVTHIEDSSGVKGVVSNSVLSAKKTLSIALRNAQKARNFLLISLCLSYMHELFFKGIYNDQGQSLVHGAIVQARESGNKNWISATEAKLTRLRGQQQTGEATIKYEQD